MRIFMSEASGTELPAQREGIELFHQVVTLTPDIVLIYDISGRVLFANEAAAQKLRAGAPEEILGRNVREFLRIPAGAREALVLTPFSQQKLASLNGEILDVTLSLATTVWRGEQALLLIARDISEQIATLSSIAAGLEPTPDADLFRFLAEHLARTVRADAILIGEVSGPDAREYVQKALLVDGSRLDEDGRHVEAAVRDILQGRMQRSIGTVREEYPGDEFFREQNIQSFIGVPLVDHTGQVCGVLAMMWRELIKDYGIALSVLFIFASRASAEIERLRGEKLLRESERNYRVLMDQAADGILVFDSRGRFLDVNDMACRLLGYRREEMLAKTLGDTIPPEDAVVTSHRFGQLLKGTVLALELNLKNKSGVAVPFEVRARSLEDRRIQAIIRDVTERKRAEAEMKFYVETMELLEEVVLELNEFFEIKRVTRSWEKIVKQNRREPDGRFPVFSEYVHEDYREYILQSLNGLMTRERDRLVVQFPVPVPGGFNCWLEGKFIPVSAEGKITGIRGVLRDVTIDHLTEKQINFYSYHDVLTGLPNRTRLEEKLYRALNQAEQEISTLVLGFIDLDNFNEINNLLGHKVGDQALLLISERLTEVLGGTDRLFRWGGDKFVVMLTDIGDRTQIREIGQILLDAARQPVEVEDQKLHITFSIGFAMYPEDGLTVDDLLGQADRAVVYAKAQGRYNFQLAGNLPEKNVQVQQLSLRNKLSRAIEDGLIKAYFQPKVETRTYRIVGMEALARWEDPLLEQVAGPGTFVPLAENMGLISQLGESILEQSLSLLKKTREMGLDLRLSVNVSRRQLYLPQFIERMKELCARSGVAPGELTLEITESIAMLDVHNSHARLRELSREGFLLSIDDFGTGYSSLSQLHEMPVNELKIDMSFVRRIHTLDGSHIIKAIVNMGRALGLELVAEGVEEKTTETRLAEMGIEIMQGNLFCRALSADDFLKFVTTGDFAKTGSDTPDRSR